MVEALKEKKNSRVYEKAGIEVAFRKSTPISDPEGRYPGFKPGTTVLSKGSVHRKGALPLPCDIIFDRDVAVPMRDGIIIYIDIFRPAGDEKVPAIVAWSPYGKEGGYQTLDQFPARLGIPIGTLSNLQVWEGPDPAYWCNHGYAVINADARGAFMSQGDIYFWGSQEGEDGHDLIEWLASQDWCNGKVGLTGNSWLAIVQWFIGSQQPPHLAAIAPWEGFTDFYRHDIARGGIPDTGFNESIFVHLYGNNRTEDIPAMIGRYPLMNTYWEDKAAKLEKIEVPAYVVASFSNPIHSQGTFQGFERIASPKKWLRIHNTMEWPDYYTPENIEDLRHFFDYYLKDIENGWEQTPRVRMSILDPGGKDVVARPENEFPLTRIQYQKLFLDASSGKLLTEPVAQESLVRYQADNKKGKAIFTIRFDRETELVGHMSLRLWVEAQGSSDMDLFVRIEKLNKKHRVLNHTTGTLPGIMKMVLRILKALGILKLAIMFYSGPNGRMRVSHRQLNSELSTPSQPRHTHAVEELLQPGQIVPVEIPILPIGMRWHPGEQLRVTVAGYDLLGPMLPKLPVAPTRNRGEHIIHTGGRYDSHLLVPVVR
jgi:predicted acyl esterase